MKTRMHGARRALASGLRAARAEAAAGSRPVGEPVVGMVEQFSRRLVVGWVSVPASAPATQVSLHVGPVRVAATYATVTDHLAGSQERATPGNPGNPVNPVRAARVRPDTRTYSWQAPNIPSPTGDRRNSRQQIRVFAFRVRELWQFAKKRTPLTVQVGGRPLPIYGHGMFLNPARNGKSTPQELQDLLDQGYVLTQFGRVELSKRLDTEWQSRVLDLYARTRTVLHEEFGYDAWLVYGTLLGAVREGGFLAHDGDFDAAFVSREADAAAAADELRRIALRLIARGLDVEAMASTLHLHDPEDTSLRIDLFHTFFDSEDRLRFPFGVAGHTTLTRADWTGLEEIEIGPGRALVPQNAEQVVAHLYGDDWRRPKPGFNWHLDRADYVPEAHLTTEQRTEVYWANFYEHHGYDQGSTFQQFVASRDGTPGTVIDVGCGDGRDSRAFAAGGRTVLGLDQSAVGVEHAAEQAAQQGVTERARFEVCDVGDPAHLRSVVERAVAEADGPVLFYLRFFLHAINEQVQDGLMEVLSDVARPGDQLAAEFRTDKDEERAKVHGKHYRRFQNAAEFSARLQGEYSFAVLHEEEGTGLSPYQDEDPVLYRVVAERR